MQDLQALPDEAFTKSFGGKSRTVADIVHEVNLVNSHVTTLMRGEQAPPWPNEGWITAPPELNTKDAVMAAFKESSENAISAAESFSPEQFEEPMQSERGETNRFERCRFMAMHMWYHSGQFNYIQTLLGDSEWHWE